MSKSLNIKELELTAAQRTVVDELAEQFKVELFALRKVGNMTPKLLCPVCGRSARARFVRLTHFINPLQIAAKITNPRGVFRWNRVVRDTYPGVRTDFQQAEKLGLIQAKDEAGHLLPTGSWALTSKGRTVLARARAGFDFGSTGVYIFANRVIARRSKRGKEIML